MHIGYELKDLLPIPANLQIPRKPAVWMDRSLIHVLVCEAGDKRIEVVAVRSFDQPLDDRQTIIHDQSVLVD